jgi:hypothetical protein
MLLVRAERVLQRGAQRQRVNSKVRIVASLSVVGDKSRQCPAILQLSIEKSKRGTGMLSSEKTEGDQKGIQTRKYTFSCPCVAIYRIA